MWVCLKVSLLLLASLCSVPQAAEQAGITYEDLTELSALTATELLCSRNITAVEYATALLRRAEEIHCLNAYAQLEPDKVLKAAAAVDERAARGEDVRPLCGLAVAVKDNIDVAGYRTTAGTPALEAFVLETSAPLIDKLQALNGIVLGKTGMHELAEGVTSISPHYGAILNPYKPDVHVGGSSGGTAALVAARGAAVGFCTDTGGSCRMPASLTGTVGYRPTSYGDQGQSCYEAGSGIVPLTTTRDTVGLMARSVADIKLLDTVLSDCPRTDWNVSLKGMRIGFPTDWWHDLGEEVEPAFAAAVEAMTAAGVEVVGFNVTEMLRTQEEHAHDQFTYIYELPRELSRYLFQHRYRLSLPELIEKVACPLVKKSLEEWSYRDVNTWPTPRQYAHMLGTVVPHITEMWVEYFDTNRIDVVAVPTTPITARPIGAAEPYSEINGRLEATLHVYSRTAEVDCPSAVPGLSLPIGLAADGLPIGLQLHSRPGDDGMMLAVGEALEAIFQAPAPPRKPACQGCTATVSLREPTEGVSLDVYGREEAHRAAADLSIYSFAMDGSCDFLASRQERDEL